MKKLINKAITILGFRHCFDYFENKLYKLIFWNSFYLFKFLASPEDHREYRAQLRKEQDIRCAKMEKEMPDEPLSWKEFEEDIMGWDYSE